MARRVVVTGLGVCCPLGTGVPLVWKRLLDGHSGITSIANRADFEQIPAKIAGLVPRGSNPGEFQESDWVSPSQRRSMSLATVYALCASSEALNDANWRPDNERDCLQTGVAIGSAQVSIPEIAKAAEQLASGQYRAITPYLMPILMMNMACGQVSIRFGLKGPNHAVSTACATGAHAIGDAAMMIRRGICDVMVAGGTEACVDPITMAGLCRAKSLSTKFNHKPQSASRPFDKSRSGFVISEGAGVIILEELDHAKARNAKIYGEILGYGLSGDAYHITLPSGPGAERSMWLALKDAGIAPEAVGHVNAHATSTPAGDASENRVLKAVFKEHMYKLLVSASKSSIGHLLGASGSVESIFSILSVFHGIVPPTLNIECLEPEFDLNYVPERPQCWNQEGKRIAVKNSFGFGGTNATLCIGQYIAE